MGRTEIKTFSFEPLTDLKSLQPVMRHVIISLIRQSSAAVALVSHLIFFLAVYRITCNKKLRQPNFTKKRVRCFRRCKLAQEDADGTLLIRPTDFKVCGELGVTIFRVG
jgi:hypothetical protein